MKMQKTFKCGKLYLLNIPKTLCGVSLYTFRDPQKDHIGDLLSESVKANDVFVLLEYYNFPNTVLQHRFRVLTKNGTIGWLTISNVLIDYMVPASNGEVGWAHAHRETLFEQQDEE